MTRLSVSWSERAYQQELLEINHSATFCRTMDSKWDVPGNKNVKSVSLKTYSLVLSLGMVQNPSHYNLPFAYSYLFAGIFIKTTILFHNAAIAVSTCLTFLICLFMQL